MKLQPYYHYQLWVRYRYLLFSEFILVYIPHLSTGLNAYYVSKCNETLINI